MQLVHPRYKILTSISEGGKEELQLIEHIARVCYKSEDKIKDDSAEKMIKSLIKSEHLAMLEHSSLSVLFTVDRGVTHELVRHRVASFAQESTRYCNYSNDKFDNNISVINPRESIKYDSKMNQMTAEQISDIMEVWSDGILAAEDAYLKLIEMGASPQFARGVLPTATKAEITVTANYREWRHIFQLRCQGTTGAPHPQMKEIMLPLLKDVSERIPIIFDDIAEACFMSNLD